MKTNKVVPVILIFLALGVAVQGVQVDMEKIKEIESGGNPEAVGRAGEVGLYQIMPVVRKSYNQRTGHSYSRGDLFDPGINHQIADWYLHDRIPEMLRYYEIQVTVRTVIWAYNAGIGRVLEGIMPEVTERYIERYQEVQG